MLPPQDAVEAAWLAAAAAELEGAAAPPPRGSPQRSSPARPPPTTAQRVEQLLTWHADACDRVASCAHAGRAGGAVAALFAGGGPDRPGLVDRVVSLLSASLQAAAVQAAVGGAAPPAPGPRAAAAAVAMGAGHALAEVKVCTSALASLRRHFKAAVEPWCDAAAAPRAAAALSRAAAAADAAALQALEAALTAQFQGGARALAAALPAGAYSSSDGPPPPGAGALADLVAALLEAGARGLAPANAGPFAAEV